jgi:hypothetical protein
MRIVAILALIAFAAGLVGILSSNAALAEDGERLFVVGALAVWILGVWKLWKQKAARQPPKPSTDRAPLTVALAESAARSISRAKGEEK